MHAAGIRTAGIDTAGIDTVGMRAGAHPAATNGDPPVSADL
jgi:hypothetical protein